jgi:sarcosine oxidase gamma subunit
VNELEFLSVEAAVPEGRFRPVARSPMERRLREAGAQFEERDGWLVAVRVPGEEAHRIAIRDVTHDASNNVLLAGFSEPPETYAGVAAIEIAGSGALGVLRRLTEMPLDELPAVGAVAHIRCWVFRTDDDVYRLLFEQEYGHYLWEVVVDAAEPLGGGPGGTP